MLQQHILSLFVRMIPEAFLIIYSIYRLTDTKIELKKIIISSILGGLGVFISRLLPIHFGVHTIIAIMLYIILAVKINEIEMYKCIATTLISLIILFVSDFAFVAIYTEVLQNSAEAVLGQTWLSVIAGVPSLILFYLLIVTVAFFKQKGVKHEQR